MSRIVAVFAGLLFMAQTGTGDAQGGVALTLLSITAGVVGGASVFGGLVGVLSQQVVEIDIVAADHVFKLLVD